MEDLSWEAESAAFSVSGDDYVHKKKNLLTRSTIYNLPSLKPSSLHVLHFYLDNSNMVSSASPLCVSLEIAPSSFFSMKYNTYYCEFDACTIFQMDLLLLR